MDGLEWFQTLLKWDDLGGKQPLFLVQHPCICGSCCFSSETLAAGIYSCGKAEKEAHCSEATQ